MDLSGKTGETLIESHDKTVELRLADAERKALIESYRRPFKLTTEVIKLGERIATGEAYNANVSVKYEKPYVEIGETWPGSLFIYLGLEPTIKEGSVIEGQLIIACSVSPENGEPKWPAQIGLRLVKEGESTERVLAALQEPKFEDSSTPDSYGLTKVEYGGFISDTQLSEDQQVFIINHLEEAVTRAGLAIPGNSNV